MFWRDDSIISIVVAITVTIIIEYSVLIVGQLCVNCNVSGY